MLEGHAGQATVQEEKAVFVCLGTRGLLHSQLPLHAFIAVQAVKVKSESNVQS